MASATASSFTSPCRASELSVATTMCAASTSKCRRNASRVSEKPYPSVPSETNGCGTNLATWSGTAFMKSVPDQVARFVPQPRSEEHTSELQSHHDLVCRLLLEKKKQQTMT